MLTRKNNLIAGDTRPDSVRFGDIDSHYSSEDQTGRVIRFEGLSAAGKKTIANAACQRTAKMGVNNIRFDSDQFRRTHYRRLGVIRHDRSANILRAGKVAGRVAESRIIVPAPFIILFRLDRLRALE